MSAVWNALKGEQWGEAERKLLELQKITTSLLRTVGDKTHEQLMARKPTRVTASRLFYLIFVRKLASRR
jgi:hypothetical protein